MAAKVQRCFGKGMTRNIVLLTKGASSSRHKGQEGGRCDLSVGQALTWGEQRLITAVPKWGTGPKYGTTSNARGKPIPVVSLQHENVQGHAGTGGVGDWDHPANGGHSVKRLAWRNLCAYLRQEIMAGMCRNGSLRQLSPKRSAATPSTATTLTNKMIEIIVGFPQPAIVAMGCWKISLHFLTLQNFRISTEVTSSSYLSYACVDNNGLETLFFGGIGEEKMYFK